MFIYIHFSLLRLTFAIAFLARRLFSHLNLYRLCCRFLLHVFFLSSPVSVVLKFFFSRLVNMRYIKCAVVKYSLFAIGLLVRAYFFFSSHYPVVVLVHHQSKTVDRLSILYNFFPLCVGDIKCGESKRAWSTKIASSWWVEIVHAYITYELLFRMESSWPVVVVSGVILDFIAFIYYRLLVYESSIVAECLFFIQ